MSGRDEQASKRLTDVMYRRLYRLASLASVVLGPAPMLNPTAIFNEFFIYPIFDIIVLVEQIRETGRLAESITALEAVGRSENLS